MILSLSTPFCILILRIDCISHTEISFWSFLPFQSTSPTAIPPFYPPPFSHPTLCEFSLSFSLQLHQLRCYITIPTLQPVTEPPKLPLQPSCAIPYIAPSPRLTTFLPPLQSSLTCGMSTSNRAIIYLFTQKVFGM